MHREIFTISISAMKETLPKREIATPAFGGLAMTKTTLFSLVIPESQLSATSLRRRHIYLL